MPIYEYSCRSCGRTFDHFVKSMNSPHAPHCPHCESTDVGRLHSTFAARQGTADNAPGPGPCGGMCSGGTCPMQMDD